MGWLCMAKVSNMAATVAARRMNVLMITGLLDDITTPTTLESVKDGF